MAMTSCNNIVAMLCDLYFQVGDDKYASRLFPVTVGLLSMQTVCKPLNEKGRERERERGGRPVYIMGIMLCRWRLFRKGGFDYFSGLKAKKKEIGYSR